MFAKIRGRPLRNAVVRLVASCGVALGLLFASSASAQKSAPDLEYKVKAVLLIKLASFIEWPAEAFADASAPFVIGITGQDPFGAFIDEAAISGSIQQRKVAIRRLSSTESSTNCHMLFISRSEQEKVPSLIATLRKKPVLTVSDIEKFAERGGMVGIPLQEKNVRFEINLVAAEQSGVKVSSRLASIARVVSADIDGGTP